MAFMEPMHRNKPNITLLVFNCLMHELTLNNVIMVFISELMMKMKWSLNILTIIKREMGKLKTHNPLSLIISHYPIHCLYM